MTPVSEVMTRGVRALNPSDSVVLAAQAMDELDVGFIPVCDGDRLVGALTDRDIVLRGVAQGCDLAATRLCEVMSDGVHYVHDTNDVDEVLREMDAAQVRRLPVVDAQRRLVGVVSLGDIAVKWPGDHHHVRESLACISDPALPDRLHRPSVRQA